MAEALELRHGVKVIPISVQEMTTEQCENILLALTEEFPIKKLIIDLPKWMRSLSSDNFVIADIVNKIRLSVSSMNKMKDYNVLLNNIEADENINAPVLQEINLGEGYIKYFIQPQEGLLYKVLSNHTGCSMNDELDLLNYVFKTAYACSKYEKFSSALEEAEQSGYGVVNPTLDSMEMLAPEIIKQGSKYGVKLRASAPSWHIMKVDVMTEVNPMVGTEQQSQYLLSEFQNDPQGIWNTNMFGKSMSDLARESLGTKVTSMPQEARAKIRKTVGRIVNENKGGIICFLL